MKSNINIILLLLMFVFQGCTQQNVIHDEPGQDEVHDVQISLISAAYAPLNTGTLVDPEEPAPTRYVVSVYVSGNYSKPIVTQTLSDNIFKLSLPKGVYDFAFWADCGAYNVDDLKNVSRLEAAGQSYLCFAGRQLNFEVGETFPNLQVMLKRPVARVDLYAAEGFVPATSLTMNCSQIPLSYNVVEEAYGTEEDGVYSLTINSNAQAAPFATEYIFPSSSGISNVTLSAESVINLGQIPLKANNITNIRNIHQ